MKNEMDEDGLGITIREPLIVRIQIHSMKGDYLFQAGEVTVDPGTTVNWEYPKDGIRVTMS